MMLVVRVHPDPPFFPLKSILSEDSENKFYFSKYTQLYTVDLVCIFEAKIWHNSLMRRNGSKYDYECDCKAEKFVVLLKVPSDAVDVLNYKNKMSKNLLCKKCKDDAFDVMEIEYGGYYPE